MDIRDILKTYDQPLVVDGFTEGRDIPLDIIVLVRTVSLEDDSNTDCVMWASNETLTGTVQVGILRSASMRVERAMMVDDDE